MPKLITCDGSVQPLPDASLKALRDAVEGYIETVPLGDGRYLVVNEEGKLRGLPHNIMATTLMHMAGHHPGDHIVGNAVLCEQGELE